MVYFFRVLRGKVNPQAGDGRLDSCAWRAFAVESQLSAVGSLRSRVEVIYCQLISYGILLQEEASCDAESSRRRNDKSQQTRSVDNG